jgi:hypothetical protein
MREEEGGIAPPSAPPPTSPFCPTHASINIPSLISPAQKGSTYILRLPVCVCLSLCVCVFVPVCMCMSPLPHWRECVKLRTVRPLAAVYVELWG